MHIQKAEFKARLQENTQTLVCDVDEFRDQFEKNGPQEPGLEPHEALERLKAKTEEYQVIKQRFDQCFAGESLFGLPHQPYQKLTDTADEIQLLEKLYNLYQKVMGTFAQWEDIQWSEVMAEVEEKKGQPIGMIDIAEGFQRDCLRLPGPLKKWLTYSKLKAKIEDMIELLPLVEGLAKDSIRDRHWEYLIELTKHDIPYNQENFTLRQLFEANLLGYKEECEDTSENADKQLKLENQLRNDISAYYDTCDLSVLPWNGLPATIGGDIQEIKQMIEDHMNQLNQFAVMRHVGPFRAEVSEKIALLGTVYDTIEKWLKVQGLWSGLVSVFIGGDIAKQLPGDAARFLKVHKIWLKIMERANEQRNVIQCCNDDILISSLNGLQADLEHCQKQLESYLDGKRGLFPRFYFCSPEDLLKILSLGSDPEAVQDDFEKLFQAITQVTFDEENPKLITRIHQRFAGSTEDVDLYEDVLAEGPIEEWLNDLTDEMMRTIRQKSRIGAQDCNSTPLPEFVN